MKIGELVIDRAYTKTPIVMDGGTGTEIMRRGVSTKLPLWSADALINNPKAVKDIHRDYVLAGAEVIITNTFRTQRRTLDKVGKGRSARRLTKYAVKLAKNGIRESEVKRRVWIAGSVAPLEDCYTPHLFPGVRQARKEHEEHISYLLDGGVDFILVETMNTIREAKVALRAARALGAKLAVSFCVDEKSKLLSGESLEEMILAAEPLEPLAIMVNCSDPLASLKAINKLKKLTQMPLGAYANGMGEAHDDQGWIFKGGVPKERYLRYVKDWVKAGALLIGGCCGTTPEYISVINRNLSR